MAISSAQEIYQEVHRSAIVYDAACGVTRRESTIDDCIRGGLTVVAPTVGRGGASCTATLRVIGMWNERLRRRADELLLVTKAEDMERAKREGKLGIIFHFQGSSPIEKDLGLVEIFYRLGVRVMQLTYNVKDFVGDGCEETGDGGLSDFGKKLIQEMNRVGMVVDLSHTGHRTTMEAMEVSRSPCVFSHSGCSAVFRSNRNIHDDQIKAVAAGGGMAGITAFPPVVSGDQQSTMDQLMAHFDHAINLVGTEHIGFGSDYFTAQVPYSTPEQSMEVYQTSIDSGRWKPETYPPPPYIFPEGIETPDKLANLTRALLERGYSKEDVTKILGGNFMRVYKEVWK